jgi:hypothetical protein
MKSFSSLLFQCCLLFGLFISDPVSAQEAVDAPPVTSPAYVAQARKTIDAVLAEPEFDQKKTIKVPRRSKEPSVKEKKSSRTLSPDWKKFIEFIAQAGEVVLWLLVFGLVVLLVLTSKHWLPFLGWRHLRTRPSLPVARQSNSILEVAEVLPEDIDTVVKRCWNEGKKDEALSLLYRGAIELLAERHRIESPQGATEEEIRLLVGNVMPSFKECFGNIACAWLRLAYAHRPPADIIDLLADFDRLQQAGGTLS